jgi:hypothetical protein
MPEPASQMNIASEVRISTHGVFPPYMRVALPGVGMQPRVPQNLTMKRPFMLRET